MNKIVKFPNDVRFGLPFPKEVALQRLMSLRLMCANDGALHNDLCSDEECPERGFVVIFL